MVRVSCTWKWIFLYGYKGMSWSYKNMSPLINLAVSFGFKSVDDYYSNSNSSDSVKHVGIPLLCIQVISLPLIIHF